MVLLRSSIFALVLVGLVNAALVKRQAITPLSSSQMASFAPFTHFASTAYCNSSTSINWSCGSNCEANPDFQPMASGGDGDGTQFWYVGFSPSQNTVVVAHQGTATSKLLPILIDIDLILEPLDSPLFPGVPSSVKVHDGFALEQASTAPKILFYVQQTLSVHGTSSVTVVGHSLGAALSLLDGLYLRFHLNATVNVQVIGYGMPRVGNEAFADWVDAHLGGQVTHINNRRDPVPILPPRLLGFHHASGEVHITDSGTWESCPGQDNPSVECTVGDVPSIFNSKESDHSGPYGSISMDC
ncbi:lipase class 3 family protein [Lactarius akahatsu]|uniref:Lipase class 3 family protein n=1 Tax=Lactarius akahatsu TaxID=416441 RepID=A0AAD4LD70_9AGAM|nr:lipase class 3 family protein [Lactarius akahatsu]